MPDEAPLALRHLDYSGRAKREDYKARRPGGGGDFVLVPRQRAAHAAKLRGELQVAQLECDRLKVLQELAPYEEDAGINLEIRGMRPRGTILGGAEGSTFTTRLAPLARRSIFKLPSMVNARVMRLPPAVKDCESPLRGK